MRFPWANILLLILIIAELVSGFFGLVSGSTDEAVFIIAHRIAGWAILVILGWKALNIVFSLKWYRSAAPRIASIVLLATLLVTLALGFSWSFIGPFYYIWFSGVSWHIYVGAALLPILIWHALYHTRGFPISFWAERRSFLRLTGIAAAGLISWQLAELVTRTIGLNGADRRFTGSYEATSFSGNDFPLTSWLNDSPDFVDTDKWRLLVSGSVEREAALRFDELDNYAEVTATIDCTGGWHSTQVWSGMPLADLLELAGIGEKASSITVTSVTGYYRRFSLDEAKRYLLATHVGDEVLSHGHGFPLRLVAPDKRGFEWIKWVASIHVNETPKWLQPPLPLQ